VPASGAFVRQSGLRIAECAVRGLAFMYVTLIVAVATIVLGYH